jgi:cytochrome c peroxidase
MRKLSMLRLMAVLSGLWAAMAYIGCGGVARLGPAAFAADATLYEQKDLVTSTGTPVAAGASRVPLPGITEHGRAAKPPARQVPITFPAKLYDYVSYAVTNLPPHYKTASIASSIFAPANNPITNAGANLGRVLFYDKHLSSNNTVSCGSCHIQRTGFGDPRQFSDGFEGKLTKRHAMALSNVRYYRNGRYFWDERAISLEMQTLMPIANEIEMGSDLKTLPAKLAALSYYPPLFQSAFGTPEITTDRMAKALAQFLRSMVTYGSKYDQAAVLGQTGFETVFTHEELHGKAVFFASNCHFCHSTDVQTAIQAVNNGLDADILDPGAGGGRFKVPSLRNVAVRQRFMHDGRFGSLDEVIEFYNSAVEPNPSLSPLLKGSDGMPKRLNLSEPDKADLKAFLETLTDEAFLNDPRFSDPFEEER